MATVTEVFRKTNVLRHPALPCLSRHYTINLTAGCPFECRYCYAQSFRHNPGPGKVRFYANSLDLLRRELPRKRKKPELVYFSTACEPFAPHEGILDSLYAAMALLLENSVSVLVSTKSHIPPKFLELFERHPDMVSVEVGLTTTDDTIRQLLEPNAYPVAERLRTLAKLAKSGIAVKAKMDPLIPGLTDTDESLGSVCKALNGIGLRDVVASFLYIRRAIMSRMNLQVGGWSFDRMVERLYTGRIERYCGGGTIRIPDAEYKRQRFARLRQIAAEHDIALRLCRCKNPNVTSDLCHAQPPPALSKGAQQALLA